MRRYCISTLLMLFKSLRYYILIALMALLYLYIRKVYYEIKVNFQLNVQATFSVIQVVVIVTVKFLHANIAECRQHKGKPAAAASY